MSIIQSKKQLVNSCLEENREAVFALGEELFHTPELGFQEEKTESIICRYLDSLGIPYKNKVALHGVICTMGEGEGFHIGVAADMDALLTNVNDAMVPFHSCGHSIQVAVLLNLITAFHNSKVLEQMDGKVSFFFTPAEEFIDIETRKKLRQEGKIRFFSGKQNMIYEGVFDDVDMILSSHVMSPDEKNPAVRFDLNSTLSGFILREVIFKGQAAHAGVVPHLGKNALQAATLSLTAIQMLKDTFPPQAGARVYPILREGGKTANVICDHAVVETYIRTNTMEDLFHISAQISNAFVHCAKALGVSCEIEDTNGYLPLTQSREVNRVVYNNMLTLCDENEIVQDVVSGASGDIGDLSLLMPVIQFGFSGIKGIVHSNQFEITSPEHVYINTAKVLAGTIIDILSDKTLQTKKENYQEKKAYYLKNWLKVGEYNDDTR
ncbi:amidohydrolase [Oscillospiraceae bacterium PP1C4]